MSTNVTNVASVSGVEVDNQSWLIYVTSAGRLAYFHSQSPNEADKEDYLGPVDIKVGREAVQPDPNSPISATSYPSGNGTEVRLYYFKDQYLHELCWDSKSRQWYEGELSDKDLEALKGSGLSAKQLNGYLKVYYQNRRGKFTVWFTLVNQDRWDTNSIQK